MARFNTKFATIALLTAIALGAAGYGAHWWSQRKSPDRFEAEGDREVARAEAFIQAGEPAKADAAYVAACNAYGRALNADITRASALGKFRDLTINLYAPTARDATGWALQHLVACRHEAKTSQNPRAWQGFYAGMLRLGMAGRSHAILWRTRQVADENLAADPKDAAARLYRGACDLALVTLLIPEEWDASKTMAKEDAQALAFHAQEARQDLEAAWKNDPTDAVAAAQLALLRLQLMKALPGKDRAGETARRLAQEALAPLAAAQAAHPTDAALAATAARAGYAVASLTGAPADGAAREAMRLALADPSALDPVLARELCQVACHALPAPVPPGADGARTEGQRAALALAKAKVAHRAGPLEKATLSWVLSFSGAHAEAIATLDAALAASDRLPVADRLAYECWKPEMLFLLVHTWLNRAMTAQGAEREQMTTGARDALRRLRLLEDPRLGSRILLVEAQELFLGGRHEEAAGRFDRALRLTPALATPSLLRTAALCHSHCGNLGSASELLRAALRIEPQDAGCHRLLAFNLLQMGATEEAIAPHLAHAGPGSGLAGDLALRGGRFWEAAESYGAAGSMAALPKRAEALRSLGRADQARQEVLAFLRAGKPTAARALAACRALEEPDREPLLRAMRKELGFAEADAARVREALAKPANAAEAGDDLAAALPKEGKDALAAWAKNDFAAFEKAAAQRPAAGGEPCINHPEILSRRIELAILRRDWEGGGKLADLADRLHLDLPLGPAPVIHATLAALRALETGSPTTEEAQRQLAKTAEENPASVRLWLLLANLYLTDGKPSQAARAAAYACRLQPHRTECRQVLFQCQLRLGEAGSALAGLRQAAAERPFNDDLRELWLSSEEAVGDPATAQTARAERAKTTPGDLHNALRLAGLLSRAGKSGDARSRLLEAAPRAAGDPAAAMQVATALCRAGFLDDARAAYRHLLANRVHPGFLAMGLAQLEALAGDGAAETAAWQAALNLEPADTRLVSQAYANRLLASGKANDAAAFLKALLPHVPADSPLRTGIQASLADALTRAGRFGEAETAALALPEHAAALARANIAIARSDDDDALRFARQAAALDPDAAGALVVLGHALVADPLRAPEARDAVRRALELAPAHPGARHLEAMLDAQSGHYRLAINRLWRNLSLNPNHTPSFQLLSELAFQEKEERSILGAAVAGLQTDPGSVGYLRTAARASLERFRSARTVHHRDEQRLAAAWATGFQSQAFSRSDAPVDSLALLSILVETGRGEEALEMLARFAPDARPPAPLLAMRALILARGARTGEAAAAFTEAFRTCRDAEETMECLRLCAESRPPAAALELARAALGDGRLLFARTGLATMAMRWNLPDEVRGELRPVFADDKAFAALPTALRARLLSAQGAAENMLELPKEAATRYRAAIALVPDDIVTQNNLADLLLRHPELSPDPDEAMAAARRASFIAARAAAQGRIPRRELAAIRDTLATALAARGRREEAVAVYRSVLEVFPIPETHLHLGRLLEEAKQTADARRHYESAAKLADLSGQAELAAEARWRADPALFSTNLAYAEVLAVLRPEKGRAIAAACLETATRENPPAPSLARLMRLCAVLWPDPKADMPGAEGWRMARDLAARAAKEQPDSAPHHLLHALALEHLRDGAWDAKLDRALGLWSTRGAARWRAPMPRTLPLTELATRAAVLQQPPTPWALPRESTREIRDLLAAAPASPTLAAVARVLDLQQQGDHAAALELARSLSGPTALRLCAASAMALERWDDAAAALGPLAAAKETSGSATLADRIRLLGILVRQGRPGAETRALAERILAEDPRSPAAHEFLGDLALADRDYATAAAQYAAIAPQDLPAAPAACAKRARALRELGRRPEADAVLTEGLERCPADPWILDAYLALALHADDRERAFRDACGRGLDPDLALAFAKRWGFTLRAQDVKPDAKEDAKKDTQEDAKKAPGEGTE